MLLCRRLYTQERSELNAGLIEGHLAVRQPERLHFLWTPAGLCFQNKSAVGVQRNNVAKLL